MGMRSFGRVETASRQALEVAHGVIGGIAHQTAEQRHTGDVGQRVRRRGQGAAQGIQEVGLRTGPRRVNSADVKSGAIQANLQAIAESDEGIACQALPAFNALQQESRLERRQLEIGRHRRIQVGRDVKRWFHELSTAKLEDNKKPIPAACGDGFWGKPNELET